MSSAITRNTVSLPVIARAHTHTHTDTQTHTQDRHTHKTDTHTQTHRHTHRHTDTDRQTDRQTDTHTHTQVNKAVMQLRNCLNAHLKIHLRWRNMIWFGGEGVAVERSVEMHFRLVAIIEKFLGKMSTQFHQKSKINANHQAYGTTSTTEELRASSRPDPTVL